MRGWPEMENLLNAFAPELEAGIKEFQTSCRDLFEEMKANVDLLNESMVELRDKLQEYIDRKRTELSAEDLSRYSAQLDLYTQICDSLANGQKDQATELIERLSDHGDLPSQLIPPPSEVCTIM
ncbi:unnamed protein product [Blepharisma stoltei]|uniref:Uncharacterized protein n=1 Tax=Blepharisma stoltei TaxID=1481888 RepID=A0AAU9JXR0_9CILI|nr:unnamed protein product [Blepharisma stoltei]